MKRLLRISLSAILTLTLAFPLTTEAKSVRKHDEVLRTIAKDTYRYFQKYTDPHTGLTADAVRYPQDEAVVSQYTSPTNIAMYMMSTIAANEIGFISKKEALSRLKRTLNTLERLKKWHGLFYNWYYITDGSLKTDWGQFISTVDNGWLSAGLIVVGQAYPELREQTSRMVEAMDYSLLYDPIVGQFRGGYDVVKGELTAHHYGMFYTEPRVASYVAIGKGDVPEEHWWKMYRTLPVDWTWQSQIPQGHTVKIDGVDVFEGHYEYKGVKYVPSWGGSMFEALMPSLVLKEKELGKKALGLNNHRHVQLQIAYAKEKNYPAWGFSPCAIPDGYSEFAVTFLGTKGYKEEGIVTPHASFLALEYEPEAVMKNILALKKLNTYSSYGFYDSVNVKTGEVTKAHLALDQGMTMVSIANYLHNGVIREYFHHDPIGKRPEHLLIKEEFSIQ